MYWILTRVVFVLLHRLLEEHGASITWVERFRSKLTKKWFLSEDACRLRKGVTKNLNDYNQ